MTVAGDNLCNLIAEAIRNAECEQQPKCVWCMTMSVLAELDRAGMAVVPRDHLNDLADPDPCWFDHHGGCQAHGFLSLEPGERCPHAVAREMLAALDDTREDGTHVEP